MRLWILLCLTTGITSLAAEQRPHPSPSFSALVVTPLISTNTFETAFAAWGLELSGSIPLTRVMDNQLDLEVGGGASMARLSLSQPATNFTHWFFFFPLRARLLFPLVNPWTLEVSLGAVIRPWEYDTRSTVDGGFHRVSQTNTLEPDGYVGVLYELSENTLFRLRMGYLHLALGAQFNL